MDIEKPYRLLKTTFLIYNLIYTLPVALTTFLLAFISLFRGIGSLYALLFFALAALSTLVVAVYPFMSVSVRNMQIVHVMPLILTHLAVLSTSTLNRKAIFDEIIERKEYGPVMEEFKSINDLTGRLNLSFSGACRIQSRRTTSGVMSDFFGRLANSSDAGESFSIFLKNEQQSLFQMYEIEYANAISMLDLTKELYISVISAILFTVVMISVIPFIQGAPVSMYVLLSIILFLMAVSALVFAVRMILPADPLWVRNKKRLAADLKIESIFFISLPFPFFLFFALVYLLPFIPITIDLAIALTPLFYCGFYARREQGKVKNRDSNYPTFIRALGSTAGVIKRLEDALDRLSAHEFGQLSTMVIRLDRRFKSRIKGSETPWQVFGRETGSNLIYEFTHMFSSAIESGGDLAESAMIINNNFLRMLGNRKKRYQSAAGYRWVVYGVGATVGIVFSIAFSLVFMMQDLGSNVSAFSSEHLGGMFMATMPMPYIAKDIISIIVILAYSFAGAFIIKDSEAGRNSTILTDMVGIAWVVAACWVISDMVIPALGGM